MSVILSRVQTSLNSMYQTKTTSDCYLMLSLLISSTNQGHIPCQQKSLVLYTNQNLISFWIIVWQLQSYFISFKVKTSKQDQFTFEQFLSQSSMSLKHQCPKVYPSPPPWNTRLKIPSLAYCSLAICNLQQLLPMRLLKQHQIKQQQLKFLETCGPSLAEYAETKRQPQKTKTSSTTLFLKTIGNLKIKWVKNAGNDSNSNLIAFVYVLLHRAYSIRIQQNLLALIKSIFYNLQLDLTTVKSQQLANLSNSQIKKLLVQFFYLLSYSFFDDKIEAKLRKYPIIMNIFVVFLRKLLSNLNVKDAEDPQKGLQTAQIYEMLSQYFKLSHQVQQNCYIFSQVRMVVMHLQLSQHQLGLYIFQDISSIEISQKAKMSIGTMDHSPKSQQNLDYPAKTQKKPFFPKKSMKNPEQILKDSIKTFESLKDFNQSQAKKAKSLKENWKRKYSNSQQGSLLKTISTLNLKKDSSTCNCQGRKKSNMAIISNLYEFNVKFVKANPQNSNAACYMSSKGFNCQVFERKQSEESNIKAKFVYKKRFQTEQLHIPDGSSNLHQMEGMVVTNRLNEINRDFSQPQYVQKYIPFNPHKPRLFQNKQVPSFLAKALNPSSSFSQKPQCLPINSFQTSQGPTFNLIPKQRQQ